MELIFYGTESHVNYMRNHFLHEKKLDLMSVAESIHIREKDNEEPKKTYKLRYEKHTKKIRRIEGGHKTIIGTKIPKDLIRILERISDKITVDRKTQDVHIPENRLIDIDPKYSIFFDNQYPKLKRELVSIILILQTGRDFPIKFEEFLIISGKNEKSIFDDYLEFEIVKTWKDRLFEFLVKLLK